MKLCCAAAQSEGAAVFAQPQLLRKSFVAPANQPLREEFIEHSEVEHHGQATVPSLSY